MAYYGVIKTTPTARTLPEWDVNSNFSSNNFNAGYTTAATVGASTTTLTVASTELQYFTGTASQNVRMPVASTLVLGQSWTIVNTSTGTLTIISSGNVFITSVSPNSSVTVNCILTSGTSNASWSVTTSSGITNISLDGINISGKTVNIHTFIPSSGGTVLFSSVSSDTAKLNFSDSNSNTCLGFNSGLNVPTSGNVFACTSVGYSALQVADTNNQSCAFGYASLFSDTSGTFNCGYGASSLQSLNGGSYNTCLGYQSGVQYTSVESNNVLINSVGSNGESQVIRISDGSVSGSTAATTCYIGGIGGATFTSGSPTPEGVIIDTSTGQLISSGSSPGINFTGDTGTPFTTSSVTIYANIASRNCGSTVSFDTSTPNVTLNLTDVNQNTSLGNLSGGNGGGGCTSLGYAALNGNNSGINNVAMGVSCVQSGTVSNVTAIGAGSLQSGCGDYVIALGFSSGNAYSTAGTEANNIVIGNVGVPNDFNTIRIGTQGIGAGQQNTFYAAGIAGASFVAGSPVIEGLLIDTTTGQIISSASTSTITIIGDDLVSNSSGTFDFFAKIGNGSANAGATMAFISPTTGEVDLQTSDTGLNVAIGANTFFTNGSASSTNSTVVGVSAAYYGQTLSNTCAFGFQALALTGTTGTNTISNSCFFGSNCGAAAISSTSDDSFYGYNAGAGYLGGTGRNTIIGSQAGSSFVSGDNNIVIGYNAGSNMGSSESSNIFIGSNGDNGVSNTIKIGNQGSSSGDQDKCYIAGISGATFVSGGPVVKNVIIDVTSGQLISSDSPVNIWSSQNSSFSAAVGNGYFITASATATLPTAPSIGSEIKFVNIGSNTLVIQAGTGDFIVVGTNSSTSGGTLTSVAAGDSIDLVYESSSSTWFSISAPQGNWSPA